MATVSNAKGCIRLALKILGGRGKNTQKLTGRAGESAKGGQTQGVRGFTCEKSGGGVPEKKAPREREKKLPKKVRGPLQVQKENT